MYENLKGHNPLAEQVERGEPVPDEPEAGEDPRPFPADETVTVDKTAKK